MVHISVTQTYLNNQCVFQMDRKLYMCVNMIYLLYFGLGFKMWKSNEYFDLNLSEFLLILTLILYQILFSAS